MDANAQRHSSLARWLVLVAVLVMAAWGQGAARADIYVHIKNCTNEGMERYAYDAKDVVRADAASAAVFDANTEGQTRQLHCAGEGEGFCQIKFVDAVVAVQIDLDSGKWAVVTSAAGDDLVIEKNLDSEPTCE